jgi:hypothetical protein
MAGGGVAGRDYLTDLRGGTGQQVSVVSPVMTAPNVSVQVFVGDREITDIVDVRVAEYDQASARRVRVGSGVTW